MEISYGERLGGVRRLLKKNKSQSILVTNLTNISYLCGFSGSNGFLIVSLEDAVLLTDFRYAEQVKSEVQNVRVLIFKDFYKDLNKVLKKMALKKVLFEASNLTYASYNNYKNALPDFSLKPSYGLVEELRIIKDVFEIQTIRDAIKIADKGFDAAKKQVSKSLQSGKSLTELDIARLIEKTVKKAGATEHSFPTIVGTGVRSALVHGKPGNVQVEKGGYLLIDMGVKFNGYCSDETRTFGVGSLGKKHKDIYKVVKDAHDKALEKVKDGVKASAVDRAGRALINKAGYGKFFGHGTGHGTGLDIHESPSLSSKSSDVLKAGMVVTVEPGIYIEGFGGVRIEDLVLVTKDGFEFLSNDKKALAIL